jgi:transposase
VIVGIDVHKHTHAAALIDDQGRRIGVLSLPNNPAGYRRLIDWLVDHDAAEATVGVESPGSYGRCLVTALIAAGFEVLQVPAWRTHRERRRRGPGKTDPGDALSVAHVVLIARDELGPAQEPEIVQALATLELQRRRFVRDRTQAIQRLRADWTQHDPVAEAGTIRCDRQRELQKLKRLHLGDSLAQRVAARCIRELAHDIDDLNHRIHALDAEIADLLAEVGNPLEDLHGAGTNLTATIIAQAGDVRRFRNASAFARFCGAAPIPTGQDRPAAASACTAAATASSTPPSNASPPSNNATTPRPRPISPARSPKAKHPARPDAHSNATSQRPLPPPPRPGRTHAHTTRNLTRRIKRFIRTLMGGWAYGAIYRTSSEPNAALGGRIDFYNRRRPHGALSHKPPIARLNELNNLLGSYN